MNETQTGNGKALPRRDPWASFAEHGAPPETPVAHCEEPPWITPRKVSAWWKIATVLGFSALMLAFCGNPAPASPKAAMEWDLPAATAPANQVIEVRNLIKGRQAGVKSAAVWVDRHTASRMRMVKKCSGKAYRCITVKSGKLRGGLVGWAERGVVTIDTGKLARSDYRSAAHFKRLVAHEIAHTFGLKHTASRTLMATTIDRMTLTLNSQQRKYLAKR